LSTIEKLKLKLKERPTTFAFNDAARILTHEGYAEDTGGRTSGSRVRFINSEGVGISLHKPHPDSDLKKYAIDAVADFPEQEGKL
jgi:hypothetical protein